MDEFTFSDEAGQDAGQASEGPLADVPEMHWFLVLVYDILTLGIYGPAWFLRRLAAFQRLRSERSLNPGLLTASLIFTLVSLGISFFVGIFDGLSEEGALAMQFGDLYVTDLLDNFSTFLDFSAWLILAHQSLRLRRMLKDHVAAQGTYVAITALWTILFQNINLQHAINDLKRRGRS